MSFMDTGTGHNLSSLLYWRRCIFCSIFFCYTLIQLFICSIINMDITSYLSISPLDMGAISSLLLISISITLIPAGLLFDRICPQKLLIFAAILCSIGTILLVVDLSITSLKINRILCGCSNAFAFIGGLKIISHCYSKRLALATGMFFAIGNLAGLIVNTPYLWLKNATTMENLLMVNAILGLFVLFTVVIGLAKIPSLKIGSNKNLSLSIKETMEQLKIVISNPNNWICGIIAAICCFPDLILVALWGTHYLSHKYLISEINSGHIMSAFVIGIVVGNPIMGVIADRTRSLRFVMCLASSICMFLLCIILLSSSMGYYVLGFMFFLLGIFASASLFAFTSIQISENAAIVGTSLAFATLTMNAVSAFGQYFYSARLSLIEPSVMENGVEIYSVSALNHAFIILPAAFLIASILAFFMKDKKQENISQSIKVSNA